MIAVPARAADSAKVPGDLWEVSSQASMEGVETASPAQTFKV
jgi:hypothetical protein